MNLTFEQLPEAVTNLTREVSALRQLLISKEQHTEQQEQFLTIQQAAEFLCLTVPTIYSKVSRRKLPFMKQGKRLYFSKSELSDYLRRGKKETAAEMEADNYLVTTKK